MAGEILTGDELKAAVRQENLAGSGAKILGVEGTITSILGQGFESPETVERAISILVGLFPFLKDILEGEKTNEESELILGLFDPFIGFRILFSIQRDECVDVARKSLDPSIFPKLVNFSEGEYTQFLKSPENRPLRVFLLTFHNLLGGIVGKIAQPI